MYAAMKEAYSEQTLACSVIFHWHQQFIQEWTSASSNPQSGRLVAASTETMVGTRLVDDDSLSQHQIAHCQYLANHCEKDYSLFFPAISIGVYASHGHSICPQGCLLSMDVLIIGLIFSLVM